MPSWAVPRTIPAENKRRACLDGARGRPDLGQVPSAWRGLDKVASRAQWAGTCHAGNASCGRRELDWRGMRCEARRGNAGRSVGRVEARVCGGTESPIRAGLGGELAVRLQGRQPRVTAKSADDNPKWPDKTAPAGPTTGPQWGLEVNRPAHAQGSANIWQLAARKRQIRATREAIGCGRGGI